MSEIGIIRNGGMIMQDGLVTALGASDVIERALPSDAAVIDAEGRIVLPGLIDAHTHPVFAGNRVEEFEMRATGATYEQIAERGGGIQSTVRKTRAASEAELFEQARKHARWFLECGTTTVEAKSGYGLTLTDEIKILRVIHELNGATPLEFVPTFLGAHAVPAGETSDDYLETVINDMLPKVAVERLAEYCDVFCERGYFDIAASRRVLLAAKEHGLRARIHADQLTNCGGAALAAEVGAATADHLEQTETSGIAALRAAGVQPVLLPASVYSLGKTRYPHAREMIEADLAVVLATDFNPGSSPTPSLQMVLSLAATQMKMTVAEGLTACTVNAAYSLNRGDRIGSLEPGKLGNFAFYDCSDYRELGYYFGFSQASSVYVRGECVFQA